MLAVVPERECEVEKINLLDKCVPPGFRQRCRLLVQLCLSSWQLLLAELVELRAPPGRPDRAAQNNGRDEPPGAERA